MNKIGAVLAAEEPAPQIDPVQVVLFDITKKAAQATSVMDRVDELLVELNSDRNNFFSNPTPLSEEAWKGYITLRNRKSNELYRIWPQKKKQSGPKRFWEKIRHPNRG